MTTLVAFSLTILMCALILILTGSIGMTGMFFFGAGFGWQIGNIINAHIQRTKEIG